MVPGLPVCRRPLKRTFRMITTSAAPALIVIPGVPVTSVDATWPPPPSSVIDLVIVSSPKPPGSMASISPPVAVFEMAPAQVLHGAVRLHGLASLPTPETQVRVACACAGAMVRPTTKSTPRKAEQRADFGEVKGVMILAPYVRCLVTTVSNAADAKGSGRRDCFWVRRRYGGVARGMMCRQPHG